ncbi:MAG: cysteine desulfurase-like protein [Rhodothermales bacterium]
MSSILDVSEIRASFPALNRKENGLPVAYFDGPGGTQVPRTVSEAMVDYLHNHNANTHWEYPSSHETDEIMSRARTKAASFLNADPRGVAFGANMTTLTFHLARSVVKRFEPGAWLVVTDLDHQANVAPWTYAARERGLDVRTIRMTKDGQLNGDDFEAFIQPGIALLAIGAASNALGTINDLESAVGRVTEVGGLTFVDAVHYAPHTLVDFDALGCDFLACSPYKFYGPHAGILAGRPELFESLDVPRLDPAPDESPERLETGTLSHEAIAGSAAAIDFLAGCSEGESYREQLEKTFSALHSRGLDLLETMWTGLTSIAGVRLFGPGPDLPRTPTVAFTLEGAPSSEVASSLAERHGVFVSHGDFYASRVTASLGLGQEGLVRAGCACYTTKEEVERLVRGVAEIAAEGAGR